MTTTLPPAEAAQPELAPPRERRRVLGSAFAGTTIEWYDFYLYGTASALVFNTQFFPSDNPLASTLASFSTLAIGFLMRPLGGIVAGHLGDRIGRKALLVASLLVMGIASLLIGLLPNHEAIGAWAAVALVLLRMVQGFATGAEWGGSALLSVEHAPAARRGLYGSFTQVGSAAGMLLATGAFLVVRSLTTAEQFADFGWRIPFLASAVLVVLALWIRLGVQDAPEFTAVRREGRTASAPVREVLTRHRRPLLIIVAQRIAQNSIYFLIAVYLLSYLSDTRGDDTSGVTAVMIASAVGLVTTPLWGMLSDLVGRRPVTVFGYVAIAVFVWVLFTYLGASSLALLPLVVILGMNIAHDAVYGPQAAWFAEQFPVEVRYSGVNMGYQLGSVIGGGIMPLLAAVLYAAGGGTPWLICLYVTAISVISLVATLFAEDPHGRALRAARAPRP